MLPSRSPAILILETREKSGGNGVSGEFQVWRSSKQGQDNVPAISSKVNVSLLNKGFALGGYWKKPGSVTLIPKSRQGDETND